MMQVCVLCGVEYAGLAIAGYQGLCPDHWTKDALREWDRINSARKHLVAGAPDTLTLSEWLGIVTSWRGLCALCQLNTYNSLAIWIPSSGLVAGNVAPLCRACYYHKEHSFLSAMDDVRAKLDIQHSLIAAK